MGSTPLMFPMIKSAIGSSMTQHAKDPEKKEDSTSTVATGNVSRLPPNDITL
jgi:hypothetical protein